MEAVVLRTPRTILRPWCPGDLEALAAVTADPRVMGDLPAVLSRAEVEALALRNGDHFARHGFGLWAVERSGQCAGFAGLWRVPSGGLRPCVEIGWRLAVPHWGQGYATEAGRAILDFAFGALELPEVVGFTVAANLRSRRVMEKLELRLDTTASFAHPALPAEHPLRRQVTYRIDRTAWLHRAMLLRPAS